MDTIRFDEAIEGADLIVTGEGKSDRQTLMGKVPQGILNRAKAKGIPVYLLSGAIEDPVLLRQAGFESVQSINCDDNRPLEVLMRREVALDNLKKQVILLPKLLNDTNNDAK